jgi:hypothetical protein
LTGLRKRGLIETAVKVIAFRISLLWCFFFSIFPLNDAMGQNVPSINWISDSYNSFDVVFSGTGTGWSGTIISPSGLWQLFTGNLIDPYVNPINNQTLVYIDNVGIATFLGQLPSQYTTPNVGDDPPGVSLGTYGGYNNYFAPVAPIQDGNGLGHGYLANLGDYLISPPGSQTDASLNWGGDSTISVTSIPDVNDTSTWTWTAEYYASGGSLEVPEPSTIALAGLSGALTLWVVRGRTSSSLNPKLKAQWPLAPARC